MKVVHCKKDSYDVYIGRPSKWGNPFTHQKGTNATHLVDTREHAIIAYENYIHQNPELMAALPELKGKTLGCWCSPKACHGDILIQLANQEPYKLIIAGSRSWNNYEAVKDAVRDFYKHYKISGKLRPPTIVSGTAKGADQMGERLAKEYGLTLLLMPAQWDTYGRSAGYKRNEEMAKIAHGCIVFWDGQSKGSKHMIDLAEKYKLNIMIVNR